MIRGHIDFVSATRVEGWVYSPDFAVRGRRVYAYIGKVCVGAGPVDIFRADLADAGLGDGMLGFGFDIYLERPLPLSRLVVTFEGSDFILPNKQAEVRGKEEGGGVGIDYESEQAQWRFMFERNWLTESQYRILGDLARFGCRPHEITPETRVGERRKRAGELARRVLAINALRATEVTRLDDLALTDLAALDLIAPLRIPARPAIVALWAHSRHLLRIGEGSHVPGVAAGLPDRSAGTIEYAFGETTVLFVNLDAVVVPIPALSESADIVVWRLDAV